MGEFCAEMSPALAQGFAKMREPLIGISDKTLPVVLPDIVADRVGPGELFGVARNMWTDVYKPEGLKSAVGLFSPEQDNIPQIEEIRANAIRELSRLRKVGLIVQSAYELFDNSHEAPIEHVKLMRRLGSLKDNWENTKRIPEKVLKKFEKSVGFFTEVDLGARFCPASNDDFREYFLRTTQEVKGNLHERGMTRKEYHEIRKWGVRHLMNAYQLRGIISYSRPVHQTFQFLEAIHGKMGDRHDELLAASAGGGGSEQMVTLGSSVLNRLTVYMARQEQALLPIDVSDSVSVGAFNALESRAGV